MKIYTVAVLAFLIYLSNPASEWLSVTWGLIGGGLILFNLVMAGAWAISKIGGGDVTTHKSH